jgi:hypothetical protein
VNVDRMIMVARDVGALITGFGILAHQTLAVEPGKASEALLLVGTGLITGVGINRLRSLRTGDGQMPTQESWSQSVPPDSGSESVR